MGYTHYWGLDRRAIFGRTKQLEKQYQAALRECQQIVHFYNKTMKEIDPKHEGRLSGYTAHTDIGSYGGLEVNGVGDLGHETFYLREHLTQNDVFSFCKTARKPYDAVVTACLTVLANRLGSVIEVSSDGSMNDWIEGLLLARAALDDNSLETILIESLPINATLGVI